MDAPHSDDGRSLREAERELHIAQTPGVEGRELLGPRGHAGVRFHQSGPDTREAISSMHGTSAMPSLRAASTRETIRNEEEASHLDARATFAWMQAHAAEVKPPRAGRAADGSPPLAAATDMAQLYRVEINHVEPGESGTLRLSLNDVPFSRLLPWLDALQRERAITVQSITINRRPEASGDVSAAITLRGK